MGVGEGERVCERERNVHGIINVPSSLTVCVLSREKERVAKNTAVILKTNSNN